MLTSNRPSAEVTPSSLTIDTSLTYKQREIASQGGKASSGSFEPGSEKAKEAGRKGGQAS
jgi:hypothetical protein